MAGWKDWLQHNNNIPIVTGLVTTTVTNIKAADIENKISEVANLAVNSALNANTMDIKENLYRYFLIKGRADFIIKDVYSNQQEKSEKTYDKDKK